jgi:predicted secreted hydrolase
MVSIWIVLLTALALNLPAAEWRAALPGWQYEFPRDHRSHPDFKTEWWYFTGRLTDAKGAVFGYQLTFFRHGLRPPGTRENATSRFVVNDLNLAHFAEAGFGAERLAWMDDWSLELVGENSFKIRAKDGPVALDLTLQSTKPWVVHGENGVSQKASGAGRASHYFSATRLAAQGSLTENGQARQVSGESWLDREWASNQLTAEQVGWNWFSLQFDDGTELMLYQMRTRDGGADPNSSGTFVAQNGTTQHLRREDYQLTPLKTWTSPQTGGRYPIAWQLTVPRLNLQARISTPLPQQELVLQPVAYWEGLIDVDATRADRKLRGHGYLELTGYAGALVGLSE